MHPLPLGLLLLSAAIWIPIAAQIPDVEGLLKELDLESLQSGTPPADATPPPASDSLFAGRPAGPEVPDLPPAAWREDKTSGLTQLKLEAGWFLVVANPPRLDLAYAKLREGVEAAKLPAAPPLLLLLHADGKFSLACRLERRPEHPLPAGVDLSPLSAGDWTGLFADIQEVRRDHPLILQAVQDLRLRARAAGLTVDPREILMIPLEPGRVFFGMRRKNEGGAGDSKNQN